MRPRHGVVDISALHHALDAKRMDLGLTWREVARQVDLNPSTLTRLSQGQHPDVDAFARLTIWLGVSADDFIRNPKRTLTQKQTMLAVIAKQLRVSRELDSKHAAAFLRVVEAAFNVNKALQAKAR